MPPKIRVLVVDDSIVASKALVDILSSDADIEIAGTALSGQSALGKLPQCSPDLITLDLDMPVMDGLQTLAEIRKTHPKLPVIVCSALTETGNRHAVQALLTGASDYITKPKAGMAKQGGGDAFRRELIAKVKALWRPDALAAEPPAAPFPGGDAEFPRGRTPAEILAIGVSTGGPKALAELIPRLPAEFPVPIVIVQHMPPEFTRSLAESLAKKSRLRVEEGVAGRPLRPGTVWIAPGASHMTVERRNGGGEILLTDGPAVNSCRPSVDVLLQSVASAYGQKALAVVMTGMGQDGLRGARAVREAGGTVFVQDEASSVVWGMPGSIAKAGLAHRVLSLEQLPGAILKAVTPTGKWKAPLPPGGA